MRFHELIQGLNLRLAQGVGDVAVADISDDSRAIGPGALFIARDGSRASGREYVAHALAGGATALIVPEAALEDKTWAVPQGVSVAAGPVIDHALVSELAERFFAHPAQRLQLMGITGTKGKTTVAYLAQHLLQRAGVKCGMIGTIVIDDGLCRRPASLTTPGAVDFSRSLAAMTAHGCRAAVAELSSHALHQGRTATLNLAVGVFTNLTGDHLDYHGTMDAYADAKAILFERLSPQAWAVINQEDPYAQRMVRSCRAKILTCSLQGQAGENHATAEILALASDHSRVVFAGPWGSVEARLPLVGRHNVINALQALAAAYCLAPLGPHLQSALESCPSPPGRLEPVRLGEAAPGLPMVLVDYAHTHDALEKVLEAVRPLARGKVVVLFGCGGDRDRTKRPRMALACCRLADQIIITSDNPRTEDPLAIIDEILAGVPDEARSKVRIEPDRATAIALAVSMGGPGDVVLLAGKGHEDYQTVGTTNRHFDDREEAAKALQNRAAAMTGEVS